MAFISMIFAGIAITFIFLLMLFIIGLIFLIIGVVNSHKSKYKGKKSPVVCIVIGALFTAPLSITIAMLNILNIVSIILSIF